MYKITAAIIIVETAIILTITNATINNGNKNMKKSPHYLQIVSFNALQKSFDFSNIN